MKNTDERTFSSSRRCCIAVLVVLIAGGCASIGPRPKVEAPPPAPVEMTELSETAPPVDSEALSPESVLLAEADQYYAMAVSDAAAERYGDAEYNFEKALELLAQLDPETEFTEDQKEEVARLLKHIGEDYQNTVRAHGAGPDSPEMSAFMMRFEDLESLRNWRGYAEMQRSIGTIA